MYFLYNAALYLGFLLLTPRFLYDKLTDGKWAAGFSQRLGEVSEFDSGGRRVVLLHCVSVGEANAALPLAKKLKERFPDLALIVSTTTRTGQEVARAGYASIADSVVYFPFDFEWATRKFLRRIRPDVVLLTETELWFNFIRTAKKPGSRVVIVNGRLSERSFRRYAMISSFMKRLLSHVDLALMQGAADADRLVSLGSMPDKVKVAGNMKFDLPSSDNRDGLTQEFRERFSDGKRALIIATSTHAPEEQMLLDALEQLHQVSGSKGSPRLMLVPRHPERFDRVAELVTSRGLSLARRTSRPTQNDRSADVILLDSMGELRNAYPLADVVFVGGSLIPHGGQSIFEPAAAGKAIVTGPFTANFKAAVEEFASKEAIVQLSASSVEELSATLGNLLADDCRRDALGRNALATIEANRGAVDRTLRFLEPLLTGRG